MITIKELRWSNAFSYAGGNALNFVSAPLTQLVGKNGHGKSSIALILEEVLFNKNSKGIKKADILNRYIQDKSYQIELDLEKDGVLYTIKSVRGNQQTVKLLKNGQDISAHTATSTYKIIEEIIGIDHKGFSQIVYQSNAGSLEFLTAADTARKKFLIEILNLTQYTKAAEVFKEVAGDLAKEIAVVQGQVNTVKAWLDKYEKTDLTTKALVLVPEVNKQDLQQVLELETSLKSIDSTNKKISQNNTYKELLTKINLTPIPPKPLQTAEPLQTEKVKLDKSIQDANAFIKKMQQLKDTCPTCLSKINQAKVLDMINDQLYDIEQHEQKLTEIIASLADLQKAWQAWEKAEKAQELWEKYHQLIDSTIPSDLLNSEDLQTKIATLEKSIQETRQQIQRAEQQNAMATAHNAKVDAVSKQLAEMNEELEQYSGALHILNERMSIIQVLNKTFSTTGLVAYKIECLVKDLESITNKYLVDLSDGRFQIGFKVNSSDKLNVVITDNGKDIEINALSGGEKARVNVATLLGIRKLMQTLSSSRINLLILDETVEALDVDGKEKLVEVLLREEHLNTFLVSHGFSHPLLEKVNIVKRGNISKIEV